MGFIFLGAVLVYIIVAAVIYYGVKKEARSKKTHRITLIILILFPFKHFLFYGILFNVYGILPLQKIHETVESPQSVYWRDEVWPGYDEYGRQWMVENYLDGIHLKKLALNGTDGKIYLYTADEDSRAESRRVGNEVKVRKLKKLQREIGKQRKEYEERTGKRGKELWKKWFDLDKQIKGLIGENYGEVKKKEVQQIMEKVQVFDTPENLPEMKYHVKLVPIHDWFPINKLYHADRITITDTGSGEVIAWSKRYMAYAPLIANLSGEQPKFGMKKGDVRVHEFDDKVLFEYAAVSAPKPDRDFIRRRDRHKTVVQWEYRNKK